MSYRTRKRLSLLVLVVLLPVYTVVAVTVVGLFERLPVWAEVLMYLALGLVWALPFRRLFLGIGREDPQKATPEG